MPTALIQLTATINWSIPHGDGRTIRFLLRSADNRDPLSVADADGIELRWWDADGVAQDPLEADPGHALADWGGGKVPFDLTADDLLANVGTFKYSVAGLYTPLTPRTWVIGTIEVVESPGYPPAEAP